MQLRRIDIARSVSWYGFGWRIFARNPGVWIMMMLIVVATVLVFQLIPLIGPFLSALISPALTGGLMHGAREMAEGRSARISHLFKALAEEDTRAPMLILGGAMLGLSILFAIVAAIIVGGTIGLGAVSGAGNHANGAVVALGAVGVGIILTFLITVVFTLATFAVLAFAIPLVMFNRMSPVEAMKSSVYASLKNLLPLTVFVIIYLISATLAAIPFFLGFFVLIPVTTAALFAGFRDVYAMDTIAPTEPQTW